MKTNHYREVLSRLVNDPEFNMTDAAQAMDCCRSVAINRMKTEAVEVLKELEWSVEK